MKWQRKILAGAAALAFCATAAIPAMAQPLVDRVPEDAILYAGWAGLNDQGKGYEGSHYQAVKDAANLDVLWDNTLPALVERIEMEQGEGKADMARLMVQLGKTLTHQPGALYIAAPNEKGGKAAARIVLIIEAGNDLASLRDRIQATLDQANRDVPVRMIASGKGDKQTLALAFGDAAPLGFDNAKGKSLKGHNALTAAMKDGQNEPGVVLYLDARGWLGVVDKQVDKAAQQMPQAGMAWPMVKQALGIEGIQSMVYTGRFDGKDWLDKIRISYPAPRTGMASLVEVKPISDDALKAVPESAAVVAAANVDMKRVISTLRGELNKLDPQFGAQLDQGLGMVSGFLAIDVENQLFGALGDEWVYYTDKNVGGLDPAGGVAVNVLREPQRARQSLEMLQATGVAMGSTIMMQQNVEVGGQAVQVVPRTTTIGNVTINYLSMPLVAPAWAIDGNRLYVGAYPQTVASAIAFARSGDDSILTNNEFQAMRKRIGGNGSTGINYVDIRQTAPQAYQNMLAFSQLFLGAGEVAGIETPGMVLPPMYSVMPHLKPVMTSASYDDGGVTLTGVSPFPGAALLGQAGNSLMQPMMLMNQFNQAGRSGGMGEWGMAPQQ